MSTEIFKLMAENSPQVNIMVGLPGSGKTTIIKQFQEYLNSIGSDAKVHVCSADHHFYNEDGVYNYNLKEIGLAHKKCKEKFDQLLDSPNDKDIIFVDNTNTKYSDIAKYMNYAAEKGFAVNIIVFFNVTSEQSFSRNKHGVPMNVICNMKTNLSQTIYKLTDFFNQLMSDDGKIFINMEIACFSLKGSK